MATVIDTPTGPGGSLVALVQGILAGEPSAEALLVGRFQSGVRALVRRHCRPGDPAVDDITQEILMSLLERVRTGKISDPDALPAYLRVSIQRACATEYRRRREHSLGDRIDDVGDPEGDRDDPPRLQDALQLRQALTRLLAELPVERDRELLRRFYLLEQDKVTVCLALGIDNGHFHRVVHRARQRFREVLERCGINGVPS